MIEIVAHDPAWAQAFRDEAADLQQLLSSIRAIELIGSTAVPGLAAKPIIDIMAAVKRLEDLTPDLPALNRRGYVVVDVGMVNRLCLQRPGFNLHIINLDTWPHRKERLMRDALMADPRAAADYAALKYRLARVHGDDLPGYTQSKTAFAQGIMDRLHDQNGWPRIDVWED